MFTTYEIMTNMEKEKVLDVLEERGYRPTPFRASGIHIREDLAIAVNGQPFSTRVYDRLAVSESQYVENPKTRISGDLDSYQIMGVEFESAEEEAMLNKLESELRDLRNELSAKGFRAHFYCLQEKREPISEDEPYRTKTPAVRRFKTLA